MKPRNEPIEGTDKRKASYKALLNDLRVNFTKAKFPTKIILIIILVFQTVCGYLPYFLIYFCLILLARIISMLILLLRVIIYYPRLYLRKVLPKEKYSKLGILMIVAGILLDVFRRIIAPNSMGTKSLIRATGWIFAGVGVLVFKYGRRQRACNDALTIKFDEITEYEEPVLYLRSFKDDEISSSSTIGGLFWISHGSMSFFSVLTEEEQLAKSFNDFGTFLAIGRPTENLPEVGAIRIYVEDEKWKDVVTDLMCRSKVVVIRVSDTKGLLWEINQAMSRVPPEKLVLVVACKKKQYNSFKEKAERLCSLKLPDYRGWRKNVGSLRGFIYFTPDWNSHFVRIKYNYLRISATEPLVPLIRIALQPFYERLGIEWIRPPVRWYNVTGIILAIMFLFTAIYYLTFDRFSFFH